MQPQAAILSPYTITCLTSPIKTTFAKHTSPLHVLFKKVTLADIVKEFSIFLGTWRSIVVFITAYHWTLSWASLIQSSLAHYFCNLRTPRRTVIAEKLTVAGLVKPVIPTVSQMFSIHTILPYSKSKVHPITGHEGPDGGASGGGWSTPRPGRFTSGKETQHTLYRKVGGPQGRSGRLRKSRPTGIRSPYRPARSQSLHRPHYPGPHPIPLD